MLSSTVPIGAGLSSSAAVEVAYALAWAHLAGANVDKMALAQACRRAENDYVGVNCGLMDQFASLLGQANCALLLDCRTLDWEAVRLPPDVSLVIADTGTRRELSDSAFNERRADCERAVRALQAEMPEIHALRDVSPEAFESYKHLIPETARLRAAHIVAENQRVLGAVAALRARDMIRLGQLLDESHLSARDLYDASGPALDAMWKASHGHPARLGGRCVGAGWAGCMIFLVQARAEADFIAFLGARYEQEAGMMPTFYPVQAAAGAEILSLP
jgi:galactokinase